MIYPSSSIGAHPEPLIRTCVAADIRELALNGRDHGGGRPVRILVEGQPRELHSAAARGGR